MTTFIDLTDAGSWENHYRPADDKIVVNPAHIASLYRRPAGADDPGFLPEDTHAAHTVLTLANGQIYNVVETPAEIVRLAATIPDEARTLAYEAGFNAGRGRKG